MIDVNASEHEREQEEQLARTWSPPPGFLGDVAAVNNQRVGLRYMLTALAFFAIGGLLALLMRIQLAVSENDAIGPQVFNELFTMHGSTMMYLFAVPFLEGLALYMLPLLIGARDVAFPRLTAFSYWVYLFGGIIFYAAFAIGAVPDTGWFAYTPLSGPRFADISMDFWLLGLSMVEIAGITAGAEIAVTALKLRAPGMTLARMPVLAWAFLIMGVMIIFAFTTLLTATVMLELDRAVGTAFFNPDLGGSSLLWQHLFWFFGHPEVYIIFIPAVGIISTLVPVFARRALAGYTLVVVALLVTGFLSFGLWAHHMFATGLPELALSFFTAASLMIALATGTQIFAWLATLWGRRPVFDPPFLYVLGFFFVFVLGGITGVMVAVVPFDWQVHDTYFLVAHFHYVLIGGVVFPALAGLYYWWPKISGRILNRPMGVWSFWLAFVGMNVTFFPMHLMGFYGLPRRVYTYTEELGIDGYNLAATVGAFILAGGMLLYAANLLMSLRREAGAPADPWRGETLEWAIPSPPRPYSFFRPPVLRSRHPMWEHEEVSPTGSELRATNALAGRPAGWRATLLTSTAGARPQAVQWLPGPTYVPLFAACALFLVAVGTLADYYAFALVATVAFVAFVVSWLRPRPITALAPGAPEIERLSGLPVFAAGRLSVGWWGTVALLAVLGMALAVLVFSYFYIRLFADAWPIGGLPEPDAALAGVAAILLAASGALAWRAGRQIAEPNISQVRISLAGAAVLGLASVVCQMVILAKAGFSPQANAYASVFFGLHGLQMLYAFTGLALLLGVAAWSFGEGMSFRQGKLHVQIASLFWYFVIATGVVVLFIVHLSPHLA
jgi:cytochrome c oxidase subunit I+III